ncbi:MAG TPA: hypothetical protein P5081_04520 [Phycisphaerae bacterium]|nr:hypothetical protein [Phycisphaerae bacterium]HRW52126.1 hypothetical protein [Phycisphaerae bacterium]
MKRPVCGNCGHDLSGSSPIQCPACEKPLIEAGVRFELSRLGKAALRRRWIALATIFVLAVAVAHIGSNMMRKQALADLDAASRETAEIQGRLSGLNPYLGGGLWRDPPNRVYADFQSDLQRAEHEMGHRWRVLDAISKLE